MVSPTVSLGDADDFEASVAGTIYETRVGSLFLSLRANETFSPTCE